MGVEKRMDSKSNSLTMYTSQPDFIVNNLKNTGIHIAKMKYIKEKYGQVSDVFVNAYEWYIHKAQNIVPKPEQSESAIWTFGNPQYIEKHNGYKILKLCIPVVDAVFFRMSDWNKRLNMQYLGITNKENKEYYNNLDKYGIKYEGDVYLTSYYPQLKSELIKSWDNMFRYDSKIKENKDFLFSDIQAGIWILKAEWIQEIE